MSSGRAYKGKYNIVLYTMDESICYPFANPIELAKWIYKNPGKKEIHNVRQKVCRAKTFKNFFNAEVCINVGSVKYKINIVRA